MRIGIYTNSYLPAIHGVVRSIEMFRHQLTALGHEVYVFCPADETYEDDDPRVIRYPSLGNYAPMDTRIAVPWSYSITKIIDSLHLDIIHSQHPIFIGYDGYRQARRLGIPLIFTYHSLYEDVLRLYLDWPQAVFDRVMKALNDGYLSKCHCIIAPTETVHRIIGIRQPKYAHKVRVLPTPINIDAFKHGEPGSIRDRYNLADTFTFITVSRLGLEKNLTTLLESFALIASSHPRLRLMLVGDGSVRTQLQHRADQLGIAGQVIFTGMVAMDDVRHYLAAANAYTCASITETQGLALLEGMAAGLPAVAYDAPGSCDAIKNGVNGILVQPDVKALAGAMLRLANDPAACSRYSKQATATAATYSATSVTQRLLGIYREFIQIRSQPELAALTADLVPAE